MINLPKERFVAVWEVLGKPFSITLDWDFDTLIAYNPFQDEWTFEHEFTPAFLTRMNATIILGTK